MSNDKDGFPLKVIVNKLNHLFFVLRRAWYSIDLTENVKYSLWFQIIVVHNHNNYIINIPNFG